MPSARASTTPKYCLSADAPSMTAGTGWMGRLSGHRRSRNSDTMEMSVLKHEDLAKNRRSTFTTYLFNEIPKDSLKKWSNDLADGGQGPVKGVWGRTDPENWNDWVLYDSIVQPTYNEVTKVIEFLPPANVHLSDYIVYAMLRLVTAGHRIPEGLHYNWPADFDRSGRIRADRKNKGSPALELIEDKWLPVIYQGYYRLWGYNVMSTYKDANPVNSWLDGSMLTSYVRDYDGEMFKVSERYSFDASHPGHMVNFRHLDGLNPKQHRLQPQVAKATQVYQEQQQKALREECTQTRANALMENKQLMANPKMRKLLIVASGSLKSRSDVPFTKEELDRLDQMIPNAENCLWLKVIGTLHSLIPVVDIPHFLKTDNMVNGTLVVEDAGNGAEDDTTDSDDDCKQRKILTPASGEWEDRGYSDLIS